VKDIDRINSDDLSHDKNHESCHS